jgi:Transport and Golgi organisation 2
MCTVVCSWAPGGGTPHRLLALRDELTTREFDEPGPWWPAQSSAIGGRDRSGGGTWCASDVRTGVTAVVLNNAQSPSVTPGAPSRGRLPLAALQHGADWRTAIDVTPMAGFHLVLIGRDELTSWSWDGDSLQTQSLPAGTHLFTPRGLSHNDDQRAFAAAPLADVVELGAPMAALWRPWKTILEADHPREDPLALLVKLPRGDGSFETVFSQFIVQLPGQLRLDFARHPAGRPAYRAKYWRDSGVEGRGVDDEAVANVAGHDPVPRRVDL